MHRLGAGVPNCGRVSSEKKNELHAAQPSSWSVVGQLEPARERRDKLSNPLYV